MPRCGASFIAINTVFKLILIALTLLPLLGVKAAVWEDHHQWNDDWENKYVTWVSDKWTKNFFMDEKRSQYYKITHDCGDSSYFIRLIFAYENQLPFVINNPSKPGKLLTNRTLRFDRLPPDMRLRAFLNYIADVTNTWSLSGDTYPIALKSLRPGDIFVSPGSHSYQISKIRETGVPLLMSSTTPRAAHYMYTLEGFPLFLPTEIDKMTDGYRRFRQPRDIHKPAEELPGFSAEQYQLADDVNYNYIEFSNVLMDLLLKRPETLEEKVDRLLTGLCALAKNRVEYVNTSLNYLQRINTNRKCMTRAEYLQYSSYNRDLRLSVYFSQLRQYKHQLYQKGDVPVSLPLLDAIFSAENSSLLDKSRLKQQCQIFYSQASDEALHLGDIWSAISAGSLKSDPHATLEQRWGTSQTPYVRDCPHYE